MDIFFPGQRISFSSFHSGLCRLLSLVALGFFAHTAQAQRPDSTYGGGILRIDSLAVDSLRADSAFSEKKDGWPKRFFTKGYPNPRKAAFMSLVLPGSGQMYNRRWWKVPLVYAAIGTTGYFAITNGKQYRALRDNYRWVVDDDPATNPTEFPYTVLGEDNLRENRDVFRRYMEWSYFSMGLAWLLGAADAFVDGHLQRFDVSDDLSLRVVPDTKSVAGFGAAFGVGIRLEF
jgi:hypothetical protein